MVVVRDRYEARRDAVSDRNILDRFTAQLEAAPGSRAVFSQESLAAAGPPQIERLLAACGDREVHVVLTVRDLARQLPSSWQEDVKAGGTTALVPYLRRLRSLEQSGKARHPWIHLDPPEVLARWAEHALPGSRPRRDRAAVRQPDDAPAGAVRPACSRSTRPGSSRRTGRATRASGMVQAEVLRRVNAELPEEVHRRYVYSDVVKRSFGARVLGPQAGRKILVPGQFRPWCEEVAGDRSPTSTGRYRVEGSLAELRSTDSAFADDFRRPTEREVAAASVSALATMLAARAGRGRATERPDPRRTVRRGGPLVAPAPGSGQGPRRPQQRERRTLGWSRGARSGREEWTWRGEWFCTWAR